MMKKDYIEPKLLSILITQDCLMQAVSGEIDDTTNPDQAVVDPSDVEYEGEDWAAPLRETIWGNLWD